MSIDPTASFSAEIRRRAENDQRPAPTIARELVEEVNATPDHPLAASMHAWLVERAPSLVGSEVRKWAPKRERTRAEPTNKVERFGMAAKRGDLEALSDFRLVYVIDGTEKPLGEMTGHDHTKVANGLQNIGENSLMLAALHRQLGRVLGSTRTADAMTEAKYREVMAKVAPALAIGA